MTLGEANGLPEVMQLVKVCSQACTVDTETSDLMLFRSGLCVTYHFTNSLFPLVEQFLDLNVMLLFSYKNIVVLMLGSRRPGFEF